MQDEYDAMVSAAIMNCGRMRSNAINHPPPPLNHSTRESGRKNRVFGIVFCGQCCGTPFVAAASGFIVDREQTWPNQKQAAVETTTSSRRVI